MMNRSIPTLTIAGLKRLVRGLVAVLSLCFLPHSVVAATLVPLTGFSPNGDGWLSPGEDESIALSIANNERGFAYGNSHLYVASHAGVGTIGPISVLDPLNGSLISTLDTTGLSGGTFVTNMIGVAGDGAIYVANLSINTTTSPFKVYKWTNEAAMPTLVYSGDAGLSGIRVGDSLDVIGAGGSTRLVAGFNTASGGSVVGNGYTIIDPTLGTATAVSFAGSPPPNAGDFRLGITFTDANHVIGTGGTTSTYRYTSFEGSTGTLIASPLIPDPAGATADRLLGYTVVGTTPILAVGSVGDSHVTVYNVADPGTPVHLASRNNTTTPAANGNGTGDIAWGAVTNNPDGSISQNLYTMSTNQGIQAFVFTLESPNPTDVDGDYNGNLVVDAADYVVWRDTLTQTVTAGTGADGSGDGTVGPEDNDYWRARFGNTSGSGTGQTNAVPEPAAFALVAFVIAYSVGGRTRRPLLAC